MLFGSKKEKIKVGVIGVGVLGRFHTKLYKENPDVELVGVFDVSSSQAAKIAQEFGVKAFPSEAELAAQCDALTVAVPATNHYETAMPLIDMGKHLLMEKPLAATVPQAKELVEASEKRGLVFGVGHVERFNAAMDFLQKNRSNTLFIEAHRLAKYPPPRPGMHRRGTEVSVVLDLMIHDLDLVLTMVGSEVERFDAVGMPVLSKTEDIANVRLKFKNGAVANVTASRVSAEPMRKFRVFQTDSYISMDYAKSTGKIIRKSFLGVAFKKVNLCEKNALAAEIADFVDAVRKSKEGPVLVQPKVTGRQGLRALELAEAITNEIDSYNRKYDLYRFRK
ncbi:MAG: Gfo/Idh/MocA family oxidoreductase [Lentisphaeria bacterium]|nr:Gfo/Idh/MocA family oxidoreductase [Lentisphaeria bacterium]